MFNNSYHWELRGTAYGDLREEALYQAGQKKVDSEYFLLYHPIY